MTNTATSKPDRSGTKPLPPQAFDKLYWLRATLGVVAGLLGVSVGFLYLDPAQTDPTGDLYYAILVALTMFIISFYVAKWGLYRGAGPENLGKLYTTGLGVYVGLFIMTSILFFTLHSL